MSRYEGIPQSATSQAVYTAKTRPDWWGSHIPQFIGILPVVGDITGYATLLEVGWNTARVFRTDQLRMLDDIKTKPLDQQLQYLHSYFLYDFDPVNRMAKKAYHLKRGLRYLRGGLIDAAATAGSIAFTHGLAAAIAPKYFGVDAGKNALLAAREFNEWVHIQRRSGQTRKLRKFFRGEYTDKPIKEKIGQAIDFLGIQLVPGQQLTSEQKTALVTQVYEGLEQDRRERHSAFEQLGWRKRRRVRKAAGKVEIYDWRLENPGRPMAWVRRLATHEWSRKTIEAKRNELRDSGWYYDATTRSYEEGTPTRRPGV